jgi:hypothetical protein
MAAASAAIGAADGAKAIAWAVISRLKEKTEVRV